MEERQFTEAVLHRLGEWKFVMGKRLSMLNHPVETALLRAAFLIVQQEQAVGDGESSGQGRPGGQVGGDLDFKVGSVGGGKRAAVGIAEPEAEMAVRLQWRRE